MPEPENIKQESLRKPWGANEEVVLSGEPFSKEDLFCADFLFIYFFAGKKMPCGKPSVKSFLVLF